MSHGKKRIRLLIHHLKTNIFPFFVAIKPQYKVITASGLLTQERWDPQTGHSLFLLSWAAEQLNRVHFVPVIVLPGKVQAHYMTANRSHFKMNRLILECSIPFMHCTGGVRT